MQRTLASRRFSSSWIASQMESGSQRDQQDGQGPTEQWTMSHWGCSCRSGCWKRRTNHTSWWRWFSSLSLFASFSRRIWCAWVRRWVVSFGSTNCCWVWCCSQGFCQDLCCEMAYQNSCPVQHWRYQYPKWFYSTFLLRDIWLLSTRPKWNWRVLSYGTGMADKACCWSSKKSFGEWQEQRPQCANTTSIAVDQVS